MEEVIPYVSSVVFTADYVGLAVEPFFDPTYESDKRFFVAVRDGYRFRRASRAEFSKLKTVDHRQYDFRERHTKAFEVSADPCDDWENPETRTSKHVHMNGESITLSLLCRSGIDDAARFDDEWWIATTEGLLIASLHGDVQTHIDIGWSASAAISSDPWTNNKWIFTRSGITVVSSHHSIRYRAWPSHDFVDDRQAPDVVINDSEALPNQFAVLAYMLGEKHYQAFFNATRNVAVPDGGEILYSYAMGGYPPAYTPLLPTELNVLLEIAEPTVAWRRFVCMLNSDEARELCATALESWPASKP